GGAALERGPVMGDVLLVLPNDVLRSAPCRGAASYRRGPPVSLPVIPRTSRGECQAPSTAMRRAHGAGTPSLRGAGQPIPELPQPVQRLVLELAAALLADADPRRDRRVRFDAVSPEPVA